jgi:hypothetical protein
MRVCLLQSALLFTMITPGGATGIDELLGKASAVVEGAVRESHITGSTVTLQIEISAVLVGSVRRGDSLTVGCNSLKHVFQGVHPQPWAFSQILFLRATEGGGWACVPVDMRGYSALGFLGYPQAPPCAEGSLQALDPKSVRERILVRVAESALCGARPAWPRVLEASSPWRNPVGTPGSPPLQDPSEFDRRVFRELIKSPRRELHIEALRGLLHWGDPLAFELLAKNYRDYQNDPKEWLPLCQTIEQSLRDPLMIPHLAKLLSIRDAALQSATVTALQRLPTPAAVVLLGNLLASPDIEMPLALVAAKGLAEFANGCPMTTRDSDRTSADSFPRCDKAAAFRTAETIANFAPRAGVNGDDDWHVRFWRNWWFTNGSRVAALVAE